MADSVATDAIVRRIEAGRRNRPAHLAQMKAKQAEGLCVARQCAAILKRDYGVERVVLFGSLLDVGRMWWGSDIDLAVWGLAKHDLFKAGAAIEHGHDFEIDLVPVPDARPHILAAINEGKVL
ncbi:MAG: nucleotidyltransferase domain-containing protein [Thermosynechococcaceae cyanobacterium]